MAMRTHAGLPWNGPTTSSPLLYKIEAAPVEVRQRVVDERRGIGGVGDQIALACQQAGEVARKLVVAGGRVA